MPIFTFRNPKIMISRYWWKKKFSIPSFFYFARMQRTHFVLKVFWCLGGLWFYVDEFWFHRSLWLCDYYRVSQGVLGFPCASLGSVLKNSIHPYQPSQRYYSDYWVLVNYKTLWWDSGPDPKRVILSSFQYKFYKINHKIFKI